jgi:phosphoribosylaminoimidazole synthetase
MRPTNRGKIEKYCRGEVISYADASVSNDAGKKFVDLIKPLCKSTRRSGYDTDLRGFGGLFDLAAAGYNSAERVLIGATDGVGTKLRIIQATGNHETVGIDLVAMCVNDLIVAGGEPLFFLDYFATGHLEIEEAAAVVKGIAEGCRQSNCGLIGGEMAEMPSMYAPGDFDLAGFSVGAVHRDRIVPHGICAGELLLGLTSICIHSNGFSLMRKLVEKQGLNYDSPCPWDTDKTIGDLLLTPKKIYVKACVPSSMEVFFLKTFQEIFRLVSTPRLQCTFLSFLILFKETRKARKTSCLLLVKQMSMKWVFSLKGQTKLL